MSEEKVVYEDIHDLHDASEFSLSYLWEDETQEMQETTIISNCIQHDNNVTNSTNKLPNKPKETKKQNMKQIASQSTSSQVF